MDAVGQDSVIDALCVGFDQLPPSIPGEKWTVLSGPVIMVVDYIRLEVAGDMLHQVHLVVGQGGEQSRKLLRLFQHGA